MGVQSARSQPVTILTPIPRWWAWWLRFSWPGAERFPLVSTIVHAPLLKLRFIHFAHWGLLSRLPSRGGERLPDPFIVFNSNFNGDVNAYLDAFSIMVPVRMRLLWQGAYNFPGPLPLGRFRDYVMSRALTARHYYCAYPEASAKTIVAGLELLDHFPLLARDAAELGAEEFAEKWHEFLAKRGELL